MKIRLERVLIPLCIIAMSQFLCVSQSIGCPEIIGLTVDPSVSCIHDTNRKATFTDVTHTDGWVWYLSKWRYDIRRPNGTIVVPATVAPGYPLAILAPMLNDQPGVYKIRASAWGKHTSGEERWGPWSEGVAFTVFKADIERLAPDNPCLVGSGVHYKCNVLPNGLSVGNYEWNYVLHCLTADTDPYVCPAPSDHNTVGVGPTGANDSQWKSTVFGSPYWAHAGRHEVKCKVTVGGYPCTASFIQEVQPKIELTGLTVDSPATDKSWPYDPVWHDPDWAATITGAKAVACATDTDGATVKYTLNKTAFDVGVEIYEDVFGPVNVLVKIVTGGKNRGPNTATWEINVEDEDQYYAKVTAQGSCGSADEVHKTSSNVSIKRQTYYTSDTVTLNSTSHAVVWEYTQATYESLAGQGLAIGLAVGGYYLLPEGVFGAAVGGSLGLIVASWAQLGNAPGWMEPGTRIYYYDSVVIKEWFWQDGSYHSGMNPDTGFSGQFEITPWDAYDKDISYPPPQDGSVVREAGTPKFLNEYTLSSFSPEDMAKTPWQFGSDHLGLLPPALVAGLDQ